MPQQDVQMSSAATPTDGGFIKITTRYGIQHFEAQVYMSTSNCNLHLVDSYGSSILNVRNKGFQTITAADLQPGTYYMYASSYKDVPGEGRYEFLYFKSFDVKYYYKVEN